MANYHKMKNCRRFWHRRQNNNDIDKITKKKEPGGKWWMASMKTTTRHTLHPRIHQSWPIHLGICSRRANYHMVTDIRWKIWQKNLNINNDNNNQNKFGFRCSCCLLYFLVLCMRVLYVLEQNAKKKEP